MKHRAVIKDKSAVRSILLGIAISAALMTALAFVSSLIASATKDPVALIGPLAIGTVILTAIISSAITSRRMSDRGILYAVICALGISLLMLLVGLIASRGHLSGGVLINCLCYIGTSAVSAFVFKNRGKRSRRSRRK